MSANQRHPLAAYLQRWRMDSWPARERSELLQDVYIVLRNCVGEGGNTVIATANSLVCQCDGNVLQVLQIPGIVPDFRNMMRVIHSRDAMIGTYLRLDEDANESSTYRFISAGMEERGGGATPLSFRQYQLSRPARAPRAQWGLRDRAPSPYSLATLWNTGLSPSDLIVRDGIAVADLWVARVQPAVTLGVAEAITNVAVRGWHPDELLEGGQVALEDAQHFIDNHASVLARSLRIIEDPSNADAVGLSGHALAPDAIITVQASVFRALHEHADACIIARVNRFGQSMPLVWILREGTVMAGMNPGLSNRVFSSERIPNMSVENP